MLVVRGWSHECSRKVVGLAKDALQADTSADRSKHLEMALGGLEMKQSKSPWFGSGVVRGGLYAFAIISTFSLSGSLAVAQDRPSSESGQGDAGQAGQQPDRGGEGRGGRGGEGRGGRGGEGRGGRGGEGRGGRGGEGRGGRDGEGRGGRGGEGRGGRDGEGRGGRGGEGRGGPGSGLGLMGTPEGLFTPDFMTRDVPMVMEVTSLEDGQRMIIAQLFDDYDSSFREYLEQLQLENRFSPGKLCA